MRCRCRDLTNMLPTIPLNNRNQTRALCCRFYMRRYPEEPQPPDLSFPSRIHAVEDDVLIDFDYFIEGCSTHACGHIQLYTMHINSTIAGTSFTTYRNFTAASLTRPKHLHYLVVGRADWEGPVAVIQIFGLCDVCIQLIIQV